MVPRTWGQALGAAGTSASALLLSSLSSRWGKSRLFEEAAELERLWRDMGVVMGSNRRRRVGVDGNE